MACAYLLHRFNIPVRVLEARDIPGGRIRSVFDHTSGAYLADLGPTWVWPAFQPVISDWLQRLDLETFAQFETGNTILDYDPGLQPEAKFVPGQDGSRRVIGGSQALIDRLIERLPENTVMTGTEVAEVSADDAKIGLITSDSQTFRCSQVIIALPLRIAARIDWRPSLPEQLVAALESPYRVIDVATGDLGAPAYRKYDIEAWMPGRGDGGSYGEVTSASNCTDYQARRLKVRFRRKGSKKNEHVHMLNGTAIANSRAIVALLENHQRADGSVAVPEALRAYIGRDVLRARSE